MVEYQALESRLGGKKSLVVRVLEAFLSDSTNLTDKLLTTDLKAIHKLKGISREICDVKTSELAAKLESVVAAGSAPSAADLGALIQSFEETTAEVRILIKELKGA